MSSLCKISILLNDFFETVSLWSIGGTNKNHENKINDNNTVIASSKASEKEISTALTSNEKTKAIIKNEKDICQLLTDKGYKECFCEIDGGHMKVVVKLKDATSKDANKIIKLIHNKYNGYIIEVKFVED